MINPQTTSVVIFSEHKLTCAPELLLFLLDLGIPRSNLLIASFEPKAPELDYNTAIVASASRGNISHCIFADANVRPVYGKTAETLEGRYDFTFASVNGSKEAAFDPSFWVCERQSLLKLGTPKLFFNELNATGTNLIKDHLSSFVDIVKAKNLSFGASGLVVKIGDGEPAPPIAILKSDYTKS